MTIDDNDDMIERYHAGMDAYFKGAPAPEEMHAREGWHDAQRASKVRVVMPERCEGYYHMAPEPPEEAPFDDFAQVEAHERWKDRAS